MPISRVSPGSEGGSSEPFDYSHQSILHPAIRGLALHIDVVFDVERPLEDAGTAFEADVEAFHLGDVVLTAASLGEQRYVRSAARVRRDGMDHFVLNLYRTGGWRAQTVRGDFTGTAGQVSVLDLASELVSDEPHADLVALFVPRSLLEDRLPNLGALQGNTPNGPSGVLLAEYMDLLARRLPTLPEGDGQALCQPRARCLRFASAPRLPMSNQPVPVLNWFCNTAPGGSLKGTSAQAT